MARLDKLNLWIFIIIHTKSWNTYYTNFSILLTYFIGLTLHYIWINKNIYNCMTIFFEDVTNGNIYFFNVDEILHFTRQAVLKKHLLSNHGRGWLATEIQDVTRRSRKLIWSDIHYQLFCLCSRNQESFNSPWKKWQFFSTAIFRSNWRTSECGPLYSIRRGYVSNLSSPLTLSIKTYFMNKALK